MGYITLGMIALTIIAILFGMLFGMGRGRNRAILRLILIIGCIVGAILLRETATKIIMGIDTGDGTIGETIVGSFSQGSDQMPESMQTLMLAMIEICFGLISYLVVFIILRFISWLIIFPICKIFVKKGLKKRRGTGTIIGLIQGIVIAFAVIVPLNGLTVELNKLEQVKVDGQSMMQIPAEVGLQEYVESTPYKIYDGIGGWYYEMLTTIETKDGEKITLSETCDVISVMGEFAACMEKIEPAIDALNGETTSQEKVDVLTDASNSLERAAEKVNKLDKKTKKMFNDIIADMSSGEETQAITLEYLNFEGAADFFGGFANYINKTKIDTSSAVSQEEINFLINGLASSDFLVEAFVGDGDGTYATIYQIETQHFSWFGTAIIDNDDLTAPQKEALIQVFGIN